MARGEECARRFQKKKRLFGNRLISLERMITVIQSHANNLGRLSRGQQSAFFGRSNVACIHECAGIFGINKIELIVFEHSVMDFLAKENPVEMKNHGEVSGKPNRASLV